MGIGVVNQRLDASGDGLGHGSLPHVVFRRRSAANGETVTMMMPEVMAPRGVGKILKTPLRLDVFSILKAVHHAR